MSNTPSKAEIEALVKRHGATSYRNRADTQHPAYGFTEDGLNGLIDEALAKWGTPQPVVREPLTDAQIAEMMRDTWGCASIAPRHAPKFARAIEAEVRKQDTALIRQLVEALENSHATLWEEEDDPSRPAHAAIAAARARLGGKQ